MATAATVAEASVPSSQGADAPDLIFSLTVAERIPASREQPRHAGHRDQTKHEQEGAWKLRRRDTFPGPTTTERLTALTVAVLTAAVLTACPGVGRTAAGLL